MDEIWGRGWAGGEGKPAKVLFIIAYKRFQKYRSNYHWFIGVLCKQTVKLNSSKELINISRGKMVQAAMDEALYDLSERLQSVNHELIKWP